jgi:membrane protein implicated in regulation of membrane protease activity
MDTVTEFLDKILFWHWGIVAVALGALEMLFSGGILMGAAIAAALVGAAAFADQRFPGALPPEFDFDIVTQLATFAVLTVVFGVAMRLGRRRAAAMIAQASEKPVAPAPPAAPQPVAPMPQTVTPMVPTPPAAAPIPPAPAKLSPQPPGRPLVGPPPVAPGAPPKPLRPATAARPIARPAGNQPMRVSGPTAVTTPPAPAARPSPPPPRPTRPAQAAPPPPPAPVAKPAPPPAAKAPAAATPPTPPAKPGVNPQDFVGKEYTLWKPVAGGKGTLRISGVDWSLTGPDVTAGSRVRVVGVEGQTLRIEPAK